MSLTERHATTDVRHHVDDRAPHHHHNNAAIPTRACHLQLTFDIMSNYAANARKPLARLVTDTLQRRYAQLPVRLQLYQAKKMRDGTRIGSIQCSGINVSGNRCGKQVKTNVSPSFCSPDHAEGLPILKHVELVKPEIELVSDIRKLGIAARNYYLRDTYTHLERKMLSEARQQMVHCRVSVPVQSGVVKEVDDSVHKEKSTSYRVCKTFNELDDDDSGYEDSWYNESTCGDDTFQ